MARSETACGRPLRRDVRCQEWSHGRTSHISSMRCWASLACFSLPVRSTHAHRSNSLAQSYLPGPTAFSLITIGVLLCTLLRTHAGFERNTSPARRIIRSSGPCRSEPQLTRSAGLLHMPLTAGASTTFHDISTLVSPSYRSASFTGHFRSTDTLVAPNQRLERPMKAEQARCARHSYSARTARFLCCGAAAQAHRYAPSSRENL